MKREKSCGALVVRKNGESYDLVLLRHRFGGHWSFPKGHVEAGENEQQTALREVRDAAPEGFWLLLAHRNNLFESEYAALGADLTLSGHGHGGLWRLPFTDGLLGSGGTLLPSYTNGFYTCRGAEVFVSRGLGGMVRLFNRPEVAVLTLRRA